MFTVCSTIESCAFLSFCHGCVSCLCRVFVDSHRQMSVQRMSVDIGMLSHIYTFVYLHSFSFSRCVVELCLSCSNSGR